MRRAYGDIAHPQVSACSNRRLVARHAMLGAFEFRAGSHAARVLSFQLSVPTWSATAVLAAMAANAWGRGRESLVLRSTGGNPAPDRRTAYHLGHSDLLPWLVRVSLLPVMLILRF
jgi:hypothetical protein